MSQTLYFNDDAGGLNNTDWNDTANWWDAPGGSGGGGSNGYSPGVGDTLYIETPCDQNIPANLPYHITANSSLTFATTTTIPTSGILLISTGGSVNAFSLNIQGTLELSNGVMYDSGTITISQSGTIDCASSLWAVQSIVVNSGEINCSSNSVLTFTNSLSNNLQGVITNDATLKFQQTVINNGTINNTRQLEITSNATVTNNGVLNNSGNLAGLSIPTTLALNNNGIFTFGNYSTNFKGRIFPQIPSSASWGNALL